MNQITTAYIPTPFILPPKIEVGENWYVKYPGAIGLVEVEIKQITSKTVLLKQTDLPPYDTPIRYEISDIMFVERVTQ